MVNILMDYGSSAVSIALAATSSQAEHPESDRQPHSHGGPSRGGGGERA